MGIPDLDGCITQWQEYPVTQPLSYSRIWVPQALGIPASAYSGQKPLGKRFGCSLITKASGQSNMYFEGDCFVYWETMRYGGEAFCILVYCDILQTRWHIAGHVAFLPTNENTQRFPHSRCTGARTSIRTNASQATTTPVKISYIYIYIYII